MVQSLCEEVSLVISYKPKHTLISNNSPWYLSKESENMFTQKPTPGCLWQLYS